MVPGDRSNEKSLSALKQATTPYPSPELGSVGAPPQFPVPQQLVGFVNQNTKLTKGVVFYTSSGELASCVIESYLSGRKKKGLFHKSRQIFAGMNSDKCETFAVAITVSARSNPADRICAQRITSTSSDFGLAVGVPFRRDSAHKPAANFIASVVIDRYVTRGWVTKSLSRVTDAAFPARISSRRTS